MEDEIGIRTKVAKTILSQLSIPLDESKMLKHSKKTHLQQLSDILDMVLTGKVDDETKEKISKDFINEYSNIFMKGIK